MLITAINRYNRANPTIEQRLFLDGGATDSFLFEGTDIQIKVGGTTQLKVGDPVIGTEDGVVSLVK